MEDTLQRTDRKHSYEFGRANNRFKLYFDTPAELKALLAELEEYRDEI